jgi:hypothetical protein
MLFEIKGDNNKAILSALETFNKEAEKEYESAIIKAEGIVKQMGYTMPLSKEWLMLSWEQDGNVYVRLPLPMPKVIKIFRKHTKMAKNMRLFLESKGLKCSVCYKNEKEEEEICSRSGGN